MLPVGLLVLVGCCSGSPNPESQDQKDRVDLFVTNSSDFPVAGVVSGSMGPFSLRRELLIAPGSTQVFWVPRKYVPNSLTFMIIPIDRLER